MNQGVFDLIVVGGGPAGSATAIRAKKAGLDVALFEERRFPRPKLCGEFVTPECLSHFEELGVSEEIDRCGAPLIAKTVFYARSGKGISIDSTWFGKRPSPGRGISRAVLDDLLLNKARQSGVEVFAETRVKDVLIEDGRVAGVEAEPGGAPGQFRAPTVVDATGRKRALARKFDRPVIKPGAAPHVAFKAHVAGASIEPNSCEIYVYPGGYGGCNRVENGLVNLCFIVNSRDARALGSDPEAVMKNVVFKNARARLALSHASFPGEWLAVPIRDFGRASLCPIPGLFTVGDAASFIDPFTGSGILLALESAKVLSGVLIDAGGLARENAPALYEKAYDETFGRRLRASSWLRTAAFQPRLAESLIYGLSLSGRLRRRIATATRT